MKALKKIVTLLIALNLLSANTTLAQDSTQDTLTQKKQQLQQKQVGLLMKNPALERRRLGFALARAQAKNGTERVLVVLTDMMKAEDVAATTEDLNIMSRIFEKKLAPAYTAYKDRQRYPDVYSEVDGLLRIVRRGSGPDETQAIYLHGYGALFLMTVDFPLSPPPQVEAEKLDKGADPVWEQTKLRITASTRDLPVKYMHERDAVTSQYDPEKVEKLKPTLIKTLKHAANIRNLKPDESVILVVAGTLPAVVVAEHGDEPHRYQYIQYTRRHAQQATLTIRAKKSDIDAYSADTIDYEQFRQRVQLVTAHIDVGGPQPNVINLRTL
jgi:hypothetical protein